MIGAIVGWSLFGAWFVVGGLLGRVVAGFYILRQKRHSPYSSKMDRDNALALGVVTTLFWFVGLGFLISWWSRDRNHHPLLRLYLPEEREKQRQADMEAHLMRLRVENIRLAKTLYGKRPVNDDAQVDW